MIRRRDAIIAAIALLGVAIYVIAAKRAGDFGFPLDDAWIHQTYGRNLATLGRWTYAPPYAPSAGSTSPLYTVLLAVGYWLHIPFFAWTYGVGAVALVLLGIVGTRIAERLYPDVRGVGLVTGIALVTAWHLLWAASSGMETIIFSLLGLILILLAFDEIDAGEPRLRIRQGAIFGAIGALMIMTRPEGAMLIGLAGLLMLIAQPQKDRRALIAWIAGAAIGFVVVIAPYLLLNYSLNGSFLPNTAAAKQAEYAPLLAQGFLVNLDAMITPLLAGGQIALIPGAIFGLNRLFRRNPELRRKRAIYLLPLLWAGIHVALYALLLPAFYQHGRYVIPALAPFIAFSTGGLWGIFVTARRMPSLQRIAIRTFTLAAAGLFIVFWILGIGYFAGDVRMINSDMVVASQWLAQNIPSDALLAVHDIGAVGYFAPRPILDMAGLVSPEVVPTIRQFAAGDTQAFKPVLKARGAVYLMVLPGQWPDPDHDPDLCPLFNANGGMGGMRIFKIMWSGKCDGP